MKKVINIEGVPCVLFDKKKVFNGVCYKTFYIDKIYTLVLFDYEIRALNMKGREFFFRKERLYNIDYYKKAI